MAGKKVLIIDDDPAIRDALRIILEQASYKVDALEDGNEIFKNNFSRPDVFLIDRLLSGVDRLDICRYLKGRQLTRAIPVIMISAAPGIDMLAKSAGADDYLEKPFELGNLLRVVEKNISNSWSAKKTTQFG
jgi:DNA-binding response OmpR family regulator